MSPTRNSPAGIALPSDLDERRRRIEARDVRAPVGGDAAEPSRAATHVEHLVPLSTVTRSRMCRYSGTPHPFQPSNTSAQSRARSPHRSPWVAAEPPAWSIVSCVSHVRSPLAPSSHGGLTLTSRRAADFAWSGHLSAAAAHGLVQAMRVASEHLRARRPLPRRPRASSSRAWRRCSTRGGGRCAGSGSTRWRCPRPASPARSAPGPAARGP